MILVLSILLVQILATVGICLFAREIGLALGAMDDPAAKAHGGHDKITPLVGGLAIVLPSHGAWLAYRIAGDVTPISDVFTPLFMVFVAGFLVLGALDDRHDLSARLRLGIKIVACSALVLADERLQIKAISLPGPGIYLVLGLAAVPFTVLSLAALTNAVNMADGRNGLVIGLIFIWATALVCRLPELAHPWIYSLLVALAVVGWFNWRGKLFLGDAGAYSLSCSIGLVAIWAHNQAPQAGGLSSSQLATLFIIPALDMFRLIFERMRSGAAFMGADQDHLHHRLDRTWGWRVGLPVYLAMVALPIAVALMGPKSGLIGVALGLTFYGAAWALTKHSMQARNAHG